MSSINETKVGKPPMMFVTAPRVIKRTTAAMIMAAASANLTGLILEYPSFTIISLGGWGFYKFLKCFCLIILW